MEVRISGIATGGIGYAELEGSRIYVRGGLPGDRLKIGKRRNHRGRDWAEIVSVIDRELETRKPVCGHFGFCGGCDWMDLPYETQVRLKTMMIQDAFESEGLTVALEDLKASPEEYRYRNRMDFAFGNGEDGPIVGLHVKGDPRDRTHALPEVCGISDCWLATKRANEVRELMQEELAQSRLRSYNPVSRAGVLRSLGIRTTGKDSCVQLLVANDKHVPGDALGERLKAGPPTVTSFDIKVSRSRSKHAEPKKVTHVFGQEQSTTPILGYDMQFSESAFSQVNAFQVETLYKTALDVAGDLSGQEILDLYCGVGTMSIPMSAAAKQVTGIELDEKAVEDAAGNALRNSRENCRFVPANAADVSAWGDPVQRFGVVTVNPPRAGLDAGVVEGIATSRADRVVYVSCNPETLARDCRRLAANHYKVTRVIPVDMFPQTVHVETVVGLERK